MKLNRKQLRKFLLKELSMIKEAKLKRPMETQSPTTVEAVTDPESLLELIQSLKENQGIIHENQLILAKLFQKLKSKL